MHDQSAAPSRLKFGLYFVIITLVFGGLLEIALHYFPRLIVALGAVGTLFAISLVSTVYMATISGLFDGKRAFKLRVFAAGLAGLIVFTISILKSCGSDIGLGIGPINSVVSSAGQTGRLRPFGNK